jgi:hypothetical protein
LEQESETESQLEFSQLRDALTPKYDALFSCIARENGLAFLLRLRSDLIELLEIPRAPQLSR